MVEGYTVTYANIQLAVFMGFSEIYLLGVDHNYNTSNNAESNYSNLINNTTLYNPPRTDKSTLAYRKARKVCDEMGVKIFNATRGGCLEEFERINFDLLFD